MPANQDTDGIDLIDRERRIFIKDQEFLTITSLSKLTGFPEELLKEELLLGARLSDDGTMSMEDLRSAMVRYLKDTMGH